MSLIHLSPAQRAAIKDLLTLHGDVRPSPSQYEKASLVLGKIPAPQVSSKVQIANTQPGWHGQNLWSRPLFKPDLACKTSDIPEGLALVSLWDSGGNHALCNAAECLWRKLWNNWGLTTFDRVRADFSL